jgi:hypothetical protein
MTQRAGFGLRLPSGVGGVFSIRLCSADLDQIALPIYRS